MEGRENEDVTRKVARRPAGSLLMPAVISMTLTSILVVAVVGVAWRYTSDRPAVQETSALPGGSEADHDGGFALLGGFSCIERIGVGAAVEPWICSTSCRSDGCGRCDRGSIGLEARWNGGVIGSTCGW